MISFEECCENLEKWVMGHKDGDKEILPYASLEANFRAVEGQAKICLAQNFGKAGTVKDRENEAYTSDAYLSHKMALDIARARYLKSKAQVNYWQTMWETARSMEATMRNIK